MSISTLLLLILIGLSAGLLSGVVGVGGGIIIIPLLMLLIGLDQHQAQGTSLAVMLPPIGILAAWNYHKAGFVEWKYAMIIIAFLLTWSLPVLGIGTFMNVGSLGLRSCTSTHS